MTRDFCCSSRARLLFPAASRRRASVRAVRRRFGRSDLPRAELTGRARQAASRRLEDLNQIERLQRTYGYFVDKSQWGAASRSFSPTTRPSKSAAKASSPASRACSNTCRPLSAPTARRKALLANHMQFQSIPDISADGKKGWIRSRAYVMSLGGWGRPLYENEYRKENGVWKISRLTGPFTMYTSWDGWAKNALNNTWPDKFDPPPDLPPSTVYLTYPAYYIIPFHYPNPVTGKPFIPDKGEDRRLPRAAGNKEPRRIR